MSAVVRRQTTITRRQTQPTRSTVTAARHPLPAATAHEFERVWSQYASVRQQLRASTKTLRDLDATMARLNEALQRGVISVSDFLRGVQALLTYMQQIYSRL